MTATSGPRGWFDSLARAAAGGTDSRRQPLDKAAPAGPQTNAVPLGELSALADHPFTRRTGIKMFAGAVAAFLTADLPFAATSDAGPVISKNCLANCRGYYYEAYKNTIGKCAVTFGPFAFWCPYAAVADFLYAAEVSCPDQCEPPPPPTTVPTTAAPPPPTIAPTTTPSSQPTCPQGYTPCTPPGAGVTFCLPPTAVCCNVGTAQYCSVGAICCPTSNMCALSPSLCPN